MRKLRTRCPKCDARLALTVTSADEQEAKCPKCRHRFTFFSDEDDGREQRSRGKQAVSFSSLLVIGAIAAGLLGIGGIVALALTHGKSASRDEHTPAVESRTAALGPGESGTVVLAPIPDKPFQPESSAPEFVAVKPSSSGSDSPGRAPLSGGDAASAGSGDKANLARKAQAVLKTACYRCHGQDGSTEGGFNHILDRQQLVATRKIVPGDSGQSLIYLRIKKEEMPPEDEKVRPTEEDVAVIRKWIEAGAPDFNTAPPRKVISPSAILDAIAADLNRAGERDRIYYRYFTITHLHNLGWADEELANYRIAITKLVNSLSWGTKVVKPASVDAAGTVLRIDLRDVKWTPKIWDRILDAYPYGIAFDSPAGRSLVSATQTQLPFIRGDWFVSTASRPPLYHDVLQVPLTDRELEKMLQVDVEEDIRGDRVCRAGFNGSGVSRNNRLIERHESSFGAYWKSYDFGGGTGRQNLFEHPLGPMGKTGFSHDGGEIIFSLPNGMQGYMLVDGSGHRIDKGPTSIVSDPRQADRAVVNGLSCMSCHARGMIDKQDQVRESVLNNPAAFSTSDSDKVLAIYKPKREMDMLLRKDAERFARAVAEAGGRVDADGRVAGTDPVVTLALMFERELDLATVAAEVGVRSDILLAAVDRSPSLARVLGVLKVPGGTISRTAFIDVFGDLVIGLGIGDYRAGSRSGLASAGPLKPGERLFARSQVVYLADLPEFDVKKGPWPFAKDGTKGDKNAIMVNRTPSPKGLGMHPPEPGPVPNGGEPAAASVKYRLGKQAALFKTIVAIDDTATFCWTPAIFTVWGDGKKLFESKMIAHNHSRSQDCSLDVSGVEVLELRVRTVGGNSGVSAVWVEPRLLQRSDTEDIPGPPPAKK